MAKFRHKNMVVNGRPPRNLRDDDKHGSHGNNNNNRKKSSETTPWWVQFAKRNSAPIFLLTVFVVPNLSAIIWPYLSSLYSGSAAGPKHIPTGNTQHPSTMVSHQAAPLKQPYNVAYEDVMRLRQKAMAQYDFPYSPFGIDKRAGLSLQEFYDVYDGKWPVVVTDVVPKWPAFNWSGEFFVKNYGQDRVTMKAVDRSKKKLDKAVSLALPLEMFHKNLHHAYPNSWTYVEDELFIPMRPKLRQDIGECEYMNEDFYSLFPSEVRPWNAMLLWGTKYSRSSLHMDPYNWTGTNAVIKGRKRWRLYPPGQDHFLDVFPGRTSGFPLDSTKYNSPIDAFEPDLQQYPQFAKATAIEFDLLPGEILFIPTGWFHQAYNVEETMAISSQMMNRNNFRIVLEEILKVNDIKRSDLPPDIDSLDPGLQVQTIMALLPEEVIKRGKAITEDALHQINHGDGSLRNLPVK